MRRKRRLPARRDSGLDTTKPVFEAFAVGLKAAPVAAQGAWLKRTARRLFPGGARIEALDAQSARGSRARSFSIGPRAGEPTSNGEAWERAREIAAQANVRYAEPLFRVPGLEPDPRHLRTLLAPHERATRAAIKSSGDDGPLPCAAANVLWSVEDVRAPEAWALAPPNGGTQFGEGIVVGHPDTGYLRHDEIWDNDPAARRVLPAAGYDFEDDDADPTDPMNGKNPGHGTATASVIMSARAAAGETTVVGTAPRADLVPIRVSGSVIHLSFKHVVRAIHHAVDRAGAHVISMSLGGPFHSDALEEAVDHAVDSGVIVLAAAGNVWPWVVYPARLDRVIAVAASNCAHRPWKDSASGPDVDITAPGESVWRARSETKSGSLRYSIAPGSGTSYAVATAAGACATWLSFHGRATLLARYGARRLAAVFRDLLIHQGIVTPPGWDTDNYGAGILDIERLLQAPLPAAGVARVARLRTAAGPPRRPRRDAAALVAGYFPDRTVTEVRRALARTLASRAARAEARGIASGARAGVAVRRASLEALAPEIAFHVASNARVRERLHRLARGRAGLRGARARGGRAAGRALAPARPDASPTLRSLIDE